MPPDQKVVEVPGPEMIEVSHPMPDSVMIFLLDKVSEGALPTIME